MRICVGFVSVWVCVFDAVTRTNRKCIYNIFIFIRIHTFHFYYVRIQRYAICTLNALCLKFLHCIRFIYNIHVYYVRHREKYEHNFIHLSLLRWFGCLSLALHYIGGYRFCCCFLFLKTFTIFPSPRSTLTAPPPNPSPAKDVLNIIKWRFHDAS